MDKNQSLIRLKRILHNDKNNLPDKFNEVLASELYGLLYSYFELSRDNINVTCEINTDGVYEINLTATASHVKTFFQI